jgi:hypothetical protein
MNKENFFENFEKRFGDNYKIVDDFSDVDAIDDKTIISVVCPKHGVFKGTTKQLLRGYGCPTCGVKRMLEDYTLVKYARDHWFWKKSFEDERGERVTYSTKDRLWPKMRHVEDFPIEFRHAISYATNDPYVETWGEWYDLFLQALESMAWFERHQEEKKEAKAAPTISGCRNREHAMIVAERIKHIREMKSAM